MDQVLRMLDRASHYPNLPVPIVPLQSNTPLQGNNTSCSADVAISVILGFHLRVEGGRMWSDRVRGGGGGGGRWRWWMAAVKTLNLNCVPKVKNVEPEPEVELELEPAGPVDDGLRVPAHGPGDAAYGPDAKPFLPVDSC
ncbi:hypothetical protein L1987_03778 [Smallanthus sonchifolius]|uniref:Uncharacterized protein n=1 Tax=Smallanthus sonchifolius TaxID=185202 RepID=A0ACB9KBH2_9ASTR|nr:hypothetical protein L1987_03778 [Smallanthus sonchifolius]